MLTEKEKQHIINILGTNYRGRDYSPLLNEVSVSSSITTAEELDEIFIFKKFDIPNDIKLKTINHILNAPAISLPNKKIYIHNRQNISLLTHEFFHQIQFHILFEDIRIVSDRLVGEHTNWTKSGYNQSDNPYIWDKSATSLFRIKTLEGQAQMVEDFSNNYCFEKTKTDTYSDFVKSMANILYFAGFRSRAIEDVKIGGITIDE